jgi:hypothetical protein
MAFAHASIHHYPISVSVFQTRTTYTLRLIFLELVKLTGKVKKY